ncbi:heterokaryon incompatibility protein [Apiospora arundinis]
MDAHHSLFHTRNQHAISPEIANLSFNGIPTPFLVSDILFWDKDVSQSLINKRGWVLQERLLSPRVIHFGAHQLLWECCTKDAAEIYPNGLPLEIFGPRGRIKTLAPNYLVGVQNNGGNLAVYEAWARIVQAYTACDLTFPSDKLVAISGIAKMVRSILNDEYVAGMWRLHLDREILWVRSPAFRPDGPGDPMGRICGGYLKLSSVLKKLVLLPHFPVAKGFESWEMVINGTHFRAFDDSSMEEPPFRVYLDRSRSTNGSDLGSEHLFCMPARMTPNPAPEKPTGKRLLPEQLVRRRTEVANVAIVGVVAVAAAAVPDAVAAGAVPVLVAPLSVLLPTVRGRGAPGRAAADAVGAHPALAVLAVGPGPAAAGRGLLAPAGTDLGALAGAVVLAFSSIADFAPLTLC